MKRFIHRRQTIHNVASIAHGSDHRFRKHEEMRPAMQAYCHVLVPVTVDSPEKQRVVIIAQYHGAADQAWSSAEVAAAVVFERTPSGCDLSTGTTNTPARLRARCARTCDGGLERR
jgi:hypothetical protein